MKLTALILLCLVATVVSRERIVNGSPADLFSHPYIASLQTWSDSRNDYYHFCGGSLITEEWIITVAHCVDFFDSPSQIRVKLGALNIYEGSQPYELIVQVSQIIYHEQYDGEASGYPNDIALLKLASPVELNANIKLATLPPASNSFSNTDCVLAGWGLTSTDGSAAPADLMEVTASTLSTFSCRSAWFFMHSITDRQICVRDRSLPESERPSACMGDSGGPMICNGYLAGLASWVQSSCAGDMPSVYTRVTAYLDWIRARVPGV